MGAGEASKMTMWSNIRLFIKTGKEEVKWDLPIRSNQSQISLGMVSQIWPC